MSSATLMHHCGSEPISMDKLALIEPPEQTETWHPLSHMDVVNAIKAEVQNREWEFTRDPEVIVSKDELVMFGVAEVVIQGMEMPSCDFNFALGWRQSNNKRFPLTLTMGTNVLVCDNLMMTGNMITKRKHTSGINLGGELNEGFDKIGSSSQNYVDRFENMKSANINYREGVEVIMKAADSDALSQTQLLSCYDNFKMAFDNNFQSAQDLDEWTGEDARTEQEKGLRILYGRTIWGAYQAVTETWKMRNPMQLSDYSLALNKIVKDQHGIDMLSV